MIRRRLLILLVSLPLLYAAYQILAVGMAATIIRYYPNHDSIKWAIQWQPTNPIAHGVLAQIYLYDPDHASLESADRESLIALQLSPNDYRLWQLRARILELQGDRKKVEDAYAQAAKLAPNYFDPYWDWANFLLREGLIEEASKKYRQALTINPDQIGNALTALWPVSEKNIQIVTSAIPDTPLAKAQLIRFLINEKEYPKAVDLWLAQLPISLPALLELRDLLLSRLVEAQNYDLAWKVTSAQTEKPLIKGQLQNGAFDNPVYQNASVFDWRFQTYPQVNIARDIGNGENTHSLKISYLSERGSSLDHIKQVVIVEPGKRYKLSCLWRTEKLISLSPPFLEVMVAQEKPVSITKLPFKSGTQSWQSSEITFQAPQQSSAIEIVLRRRPDCKDEAICPIDGDFWITNLSLEKVD